jgi:hypothetical protein
MKCLAFRLPESAENGNQAVAKESRTPQETTQQNLVRDILPTGAYLSNSMKASKLLK